MLSGFRVGENLCNNLFFEMFLDKVRNLLEMQQFFIYSGKNLNSFAALSWTVSIFLRITTSDLALLDRSSLVKVFSSSVKYVGQNS